MNAQPTVLLCFLLLIQKRNYFIYLLSGKKCTTILQLCWYVNVFTVILPTIFHYKIYLHNKNYKKIYLKAVMVANFNTIFLGQQPCQVFQISWLSEMKYISVIRVLISEHWWQKCCWSLKCQLIWQLYAAVGLRAIYWLQTMCICNPINLHNFQFFFAIPISVIKAHACHLCCVKKYKDNSCNYSY